MLKTQYVHGYPIIGFVFTELQTATQGTKDSPRTVECGIILVRVPKRSVNNVAAVEYVTAWYRDGDREWNNGHYFTDHKAATWDMVGRAVGLPHPGFAKESA